MSSHVKRPNLLNKLRPKYIEPAEIKNEARPLPFNTIIRRPFSKKTAFSTTIGY